MAKVIAFTQRNPRSSPRRENHDRTSYPSPSVINIADRTVRTATSTHPEILISVVIATRNRPHLLSHCLASLLWQRFDPARFEIIVVDAEPNACTRDIVTDWAVHAKRHGPRIMYIPSGRTRGIAAARNLGWRAARGEVIAFTNDDTVARPDWLQNGWNAFDQHVQAVWGRVIVPYSTSARDYERQRKILEPTEFTSANCFCRALVLEELGGFDERFTMAWRDDQDLHFRLLEGSSRIVYAPSAVMTTPLRPPAWGESLRGQKKLQAEALLYKKHPKLYKQKIRRKSDWDCYLIVAALLSLLIALAAGQTAVAIASGITWLFFTVWFAAERRPVMPSTTGRFIELVVTAILAPPLVIFWRLVGAVRFRVPFA